MYLDLHYSKPKRKPANEERYNWLVAETLLGQNNRTLRTFIEHRHFPPGRLPPVEDCLENRSQKQQQKVFLNRGEWLLTH